VLLDLLLQDVPAGAMLSARELIIIEEERLECRVPRTCAARARSG
jgi:hypothetical protein